MQKKIVLVLALMVVASMSIFAMDQTQVAVKLHSFEFNSNVKSVIIITPVTDSTLFAGVNGFALSDEDMLFIEGEGLPVAMIEDGCAQMGTPDPIVMNKLSETVPLSIGEKSKITRGGVQFPPSLGISYDAVDNTTTFVVFIFWFTVENR